MIWHTVSRWGTDAYTGYVGKIGVAQREVKVGGRIQGRLAARKVHQACLVCLDDVDCAVVIAIDVLGDGHGNERIANKDRTARNGAELD